MAHGRPFDRAHGRPFGSPSTPIRQAQGMAQGKAYGKAQAKSLFGDLTLAGQSGKLRLVMHSDGITAQGTVTPPRQSRRRPRWSRPLP